jgi:glycosyltransferase involved in cell wall biosynthesis
MKVLWFSNTPALGADFINKDTAIKGTGGWMYALNKEIQDNVELSVAFHYPYPIPNFEFEKTNYFPVYTGNIIVQNLEKRFLGKVYNQDYLKDYLKIIEEIKPDLIHIHGTENSFLCLLMNTKIPIVISIQGNLTIYQHKFFSGFHGKYLNNKNEKITLKSILFGRQTFYKGFQNMTNMAKIEENHLKLAANIIGRTDWDCRISRVLAPNSQYFIGNEMLREGFYNELWDNKYAGGKIKLFTTNGNNYYKGFETACHALALLHDLGLEVEWRVAGVSNSSLITKITRKHLGNNYPDSRLILLGALDENELINNLQQSHVYIMASHIENSPNNLCEAMILGMPCVATFAGGTASMLKDGAEGVLVQDGDPWVMAGAILELVNDNNKAVLFGKNARERALVRHNKTTIVSELLASYDSIIKQSHAD